jgi:uncharacterized membrane protein HdeD (DUF308 family)
VIRGIIGILLGIVAFAWPGITLRALVLLFGIYALIDGIVSIAGAIRAVEAHERWGALLAEGILGLLAAAATFVVPAMTLFLLIYLIAVWAILTGAAEIAAAIRLRKEIPGEWLLGLAGVLSILFGILIAGTPVLGAILLTIWFGVYILLFGLTLLALGLRLRRWQHQLPSSSVPLPIG